MDELAQKLNQTFKDWDEAQSGLIPVDTLRDVLKNLNDAFTDRDLSRLLGAVDTDGSGRIEYARFVDFLTSDTLASVAGAQLPAGTDSDARVARVHDLVGKLRDLRPGLKSWMQDLREVLDPHENPSGYRLCQKAAVGSKACEPLLAVTQKAALASASPLLQKEGDSVRSLAWEILGRLAFSNETGVEELASNADLLPLLQQTLRESIAPEKLSALQLVQAMATATSCAKCSKLMPALLSEMVSLVSDGSFLTLQEAAFDVLVSCSNVHAAAVAEAMGWERVLTLMFEGQGRPLWLPAEPLQIFLCNRLAVDLLSGAPAPSSDADKESRGFIANMVAEGSFFGYYTECLEAAVAQREWPLGSGAYHGVARLAELATKLAGLGHRRKLSAAVAPLAKAVEVGIDDQTSRAALAALRDLCQDVGCLHAAWDLEAFRTETLEMLHKSGDEPEATELLSYLDAVELSFLEAQALLDASKAFAPHAPSVRHLAEVFSQRDALDVELEQEQVLKAVADIPLPRTAVQGGLGISKFSFKAFAERVYGAPTILGWWPSLMEDEVACLEGLGGVPRVPQPRKAVELFEAAAAGRSRAGAEALREMVLPALGLPGAVAEAEAEALGLEESELDWKSFVRWLGQLCKRAEEHVDEEVPAN